METVTKFEEKIISRFWAMLEKHPSRNKVNICKSLSHSIGEFSLGMPEALF